MARREREIVVNAGELADALNELVDGGMDDSDCIRITHRNGDVYAGLVANGPTGNVNPDDDEQDFDEDWEDDEASYYGAAVGNSSDDEEEEAEDELTLPVYNDSHFSPDLKLNRTPVNNDEADEDDELDLPVYNNKRFSPDLKLRR